MLKLGMKAVLGVSPVTIKMTKNIDDLSAQLQALAAQQFKLPDMASLMPKLDISAAAAGAQADEEEEDVDETGVEPRQDIDLVMTQARVSESKAVKALKTQVGILSVLSWNLLPR
ncbi:hypothetical protein REPUB_Repub07fG0168300 [Reevesia pubescens]